jgi:hypothetical protein
LRGLPLSSLRPLRYSPKDSIRMTKLSIHCHAETYL